LTAALAAIASLGDYAEDTLRLNVSILSDCLNRTPQITSDVLDGVRQCGPGSFFRIFSGSVLGYY
jgi:hypothetical protein